MGAKRHPSKFESLCMTVFYLIPTRQVRPYVPQPLTITEVAPGYTIGGLYAARFGCAEGRAISEFSVLPAYVRHSDKKGFLMNNFCTDSNAEGAGRDAGGIVKSPASFAWVMDERYVSLEVAKAGSPVITIKMKPLINELPFSASFPFLSVKGNNVVFFKNQYASNIGLSTSSVSIPKDSPLSGFPFGVKLLSTFWDASNVVMKEPEYVQEPVISRPDKAFGSPISKTDVRL